MNAKITSTYDDGSPRTMRRDEIGQLAGRIVEAGERTMERRIGAGRTAAWNHGVRRRVARSRRLVRRGLDAADGGDVERAVRLLDAAADMAGR
jgi:hypothetical protein